MSKENKSEWANYDFIVIEIGGNENHLTGRERARMMVRIRDGFKCQTCGIVRTPRVVARHNKRRSGLRGKIKLHDVHHIGGKCGKNSRGYDSTEDISKLTTLCHKCHYKHHQFSKKLERFHVDRTRRVHERNGLMYKQWASGFKPKAIAEKHSLCINHVYCILSGERKKQLEKK